MKRIKKVLDFVKAAYKHFIAIEGFTRASDLAYTALLSIVPFMVLSFSIVSAFPPFKPYVKIFHDFLFKHLVPDSARAIQYYIEDFAEHATRLSLMGLLMAFVTCLLLIFTLEAAFNKIWKVKRSKQNFASFVKYGAILTLVPPLAVCGFALSLSIFSLPLISRLIENIAKYTPIFYLVPVVIIFIILLFLYKILPNCDVRFRDAALGAAVGAPLFEIVKISFGVYIKQFSSYQVIYKAAAVVPVFLIWLFVLWTIVLIGAVSAYISGKNEIT